MGTPELISEEFLVKTGTPFLIVIPGSLRIRFNREMLTLFFSSRDCFNVGSPGVVSLEGPQANTAIRVAIKRRHCRFIYVRLLIKDTPINQSTRALSMKTGLKIPGSTPGNKPSPGRYGLVT